MFERRGQGMRQLGNEPVELAEALIDVLRGMHRLMRQPHPVSDKQHAGYGASRGGHSLLEKPGQFKLLMILTKRGRLAMQELAAALDVAPPTVTAMVKRLLEQGYVERVRDDADWRTVWVELTDQGREAVTQHHRERVAALRQRIEQLDPEERATLRDAIPVLAHLLELQPRAVDLTDVVRAVQGSGSSHRDGKAVQGTEDR
jgi:DNA-binding MarR family transcriptional regulator